MKTYFKNFYHRITRFYFNYVAFLLSGIIVLITLLTVITNLIFQVETEVISTLIICILYSIPLIAIYFEKYMISRWFFVITPNLVIYFYTFIANSPLPVPLFHLVFTLFPLLIFDVSDKKQKQEFNWAIMVNILFFSGSFFYLYQQNSYSSQSIIFLVSLYSFFCATLFLIKKKITFNENSLNKEIKLKENVFNNLHEGIVIQDQNGAIVYFNKASLNILKMDEDQLLGKKSTDKDWNSIKEDYSNFPGEEHPAMLALKTGQPILNTKMGLKYKNETSWIQINSIPIFEEENSKPVEVISTFTDITPLINNQKEREYLLNRLDFAAKAIKFGVWELDFLTGYIHWNDSQFEVFGRTKDEFKNDYSSFESYLVAEDRQIVKQRFYDSIAKNQDFDAEFRIKTGNGEYKLIKAISKTIYDNQHKPVRIIGLNWDISDMRTNELKVIQNAKMATLGEMSSNIAHEINNPLAVIVGQIQLMNLMLKNNEIDLKRMGELTVSIEATTQRIAKIIKGLKTFARKGDSDPYEQIKFSKILEDLLAFCEHRFKKQNITIEIEKYDTNIVLECRPIQISQVLINLLNNSYDAVCDLKDKWIKISINQNEKTTTIKVTDSGNGIPLNYQDKIFQPFFTSKPKEIGTGLGLPISKEIIENHMGKFYYDPNEKHTTFVIEIPTHLEII